MAVEQRDLDWGEKALQDYCAKLKKHSAAKYFIPATNLKAYIA